MTTQIAALATTQANQNRESRRENRPRSQSRTRSRSRPQNSAYCFYHDLRSAFK
jgi:hypothetical protein